MGYVHDIHMDRGFDRAAFAAAVEDIGTLIRRSEIETAGPWSRPDTMSILEDDYISFNGVSHNCNCSPEDPEYHCLRGWRAVECTVWRVGSGQAFAAGQPATASTVAMANLRLMCASILGKWSRVAGVGLDHWDRISCFQGLMGRAVLKA